MPELPDVTVYIEALEERILGRTLEEALIAGPSLLRTADPPVQSAEGQKLEVTLNGERVKLYELEDVPYFFMRESPGAPAPKESLTYPLAERVKMSPNIHLEFRMNVRAGPQTIGVDFLHNSYAAVEDLVRRPMSSTHDPNVGMQYGYTTAPHLARVDITGPYNATGPGDTPSRRRIFVCHPDAPSEEIPCARQIISNLVRRAFRRAPVDADLVVPVPDSGVTSAMGYAAESGIPFRFGLIRNHYVGRTFIEPSQSVRDFGVKLKLNPVRSLLEGKRVVLIDDSIVRGTTSRKIVRMIRSAGAKEVHMRISCPPTISPCFYGVDTPSKDQLIAANKSLDEIRDYIGADSLAYLSLEGLKKACGDGEKTTYCSACYTGKYPTNIVDIEEIQPAVAKR